MYAHTENLNGTTSIEVGSIQSHEEGMGIFFSSKQLQWSHRLSIN